MAQFLLGFIVLLFLFKYQFSNNDSWKPWSLPLSGKIIYLDPGHGGPDGGAVGGKLLEKDVTLEVAFRVRDYLQEQGALVIMTRESDTDLAPEGTKGYSRRKAEDLRQRVKLINHSEAELYISIHLNAIPSQNGAEPKAFITGNMRKMRKSQNTSRMS